LKIRNILLINTIPSDESRGSRVWYHDEGHVPPPKPRKISQKKKKEEEKRADVEYVFDNVEDEMHN
jgi:hypothetical protein